MLVTVNERKTVLLNPKTLDDFSDGSCAEESFESVEFDWPYDVSPPNQESIIKINSFFIKYGSQIKRLRWKVSDENEYGRKIGWLGADEDSKFNFNPRPAESEFHERKTLGEFLVLMPMLNELGIDGGESCARRKIGNLLLYISNLKMVHINVLHLSGVGLSGDEMTLLMAAKLQLKKFYFHYGDNGCLYILEFGKLINSWKDTLEELDVNTFYGFHLAVMPHLKTLQIDNASEFGLVDPLPISQQFPSLRELKGNFAPEYFEWKTFISDDMVPHPNLFKVNLTKGIKKVDLIRLLAKCVNLSHLSMGTIDYDIVKTVFEETKAKNPLQLSSGDQHFLTPDDYAKPVENTFGLPSEVILRLLEFCSFSANMCYSKKVYPLNTIAHLTFLEHKFEKNENPTEDEKLEMATRLGIGKEDVDWFQNYRLKKIQEQKLYDETDINNQDLV